MQNKVLVIGGDHQNTLGVIEALGQKGVYSSVIILGHVETSFVLKSKYVVDGWICSGEEDVVSCIQNHFKTEESKAVAIACCDDAANILDQNYEQLHTILVIPTVKEAGSLIAWTDKEKMTETAKNLGITIPTSWLVTDNVIPKDIVFPCVIKPITSVNHGKSGFARCENREELQAALDAKKEGETVQIQQFIEKEFEFQFLGCSLNAGGDVIIPGRTHIETTTGFNNLVFLRYDKYDSSFEKTVEDSKRFVKETGYSGLFSIEFMRGKDGKDYFLEMNFRNDGNGIAVTSSGTNLPYIWYLYASGGDYKSEIAKSVVNTTYMMPEFSFLMSVFNGEVSLKEWIADKRKTTCYLTKFRDDMEPWRAYMKFNRKVLVKASIRYVLVKLHIYPLLKRVLK